MPKSGKSSASSGTRKKHAKRAATRGHEDDEELAEQLPSEPKGKKSKKADKKAPRPKVYIPPVKPAPPRRDPLELHGLASRLPADLVVVLRLLGKKDAVTKGKALDELQAGWIEKAKQEPQPDDEEAQSLIETLEMMLPVWFHHYPVVALHSSRRVRLAAAQLQASLWASPQLRPRIQFYMNETAGTLELEQFLGSWCMTTFDGDRMVSLRAKQSWDDFAASQSKSSESASLLASTFAIPLVAAFTQLAIIEPNRVYQSLNPPAPDAPVIQSRGQKSGKSTPRVAAKPASKSLTEADPDEENEVDRNARYRVGALGALTWLLDVLRPLSKDDSNPLSVALENTFNMVGDPYFWSCLYGGTRPPWLEGEDNVSRRAMLGTGQPVVRKSAWNIIPTLVRKWGEQISSCLSVISTAALRSAWVETDHGVRIAMFEPLLVFLKAYPAGWMLADPAYRSKGQGKDRGEDDTDASGDESDPGEDDQVPTARNVAYTEFLDFLKLGCGGSPVQGYPVVLIALSTIPEEILPLTKDALDNLYASIWAAVDGRAFSTIDKAVTSNSFLASLFECTAYLVGRIQKTHQASESESTTTSDLAQDLARQQTAEAWDALESSRLVLKEEEAGSKLAQFLLRLEKVHVDLARAAALSICSTALRHLCESSDEAQPLARKDIDVLAGLTITLPSEESVVRRAIQETVENTIKWISGQLEAPESLSQNAFANLLGLLSRMMWKFGPTFKEDLAQNADMENGLFASINQAVRTLPPATAIDLVQSSLKLWAGTGKDERLWNRLLQAIGSTECPKQQSTAVLSAILAEAPKVPYPSCGPDGDLSGLALSLVESALTQGDIESAAVLGRLLVTPSHFIPTQTAQGFADRMSSVVTQTVPSLLRSQSTPLSLRGALRTLLPLFVAKSPLAQQSPAFSDVIVNVLVLSYILCLVEDGDDTLDDCIATAKSISKAWAQTSCPEAAKARQSFLNVVHATLQDVQARLEGPVLVDALSAPDLLTMFDVVTFDAESILPPITAFEELHSTSTIGYIDTPLALFDPAIKHSLSPVPYDKSGLSSYGRLLAAFLEIFKWDRDALMRHPQMIVYLLFVECAAEDFLLDSEERNPIFGSSANKPLVMSVREDVSMALAYFFSSAVSSISDSWHQRTCSALKTNSQVPDTGALSQIVTQTFRTALDTETRSPRDLRIFRKVASQVSKAGDISSQDADQWILLSESIRKQAPQTSLSITLTIAQAGVECMRLDRLRNELASSLSGVPPSRANTDGLRLLRHLVASAPLPDSEGVYLPPQRAVFLLQALQKWVASDEELDEEIDSLIVQVSSGLAPILLTIPGSHWDFVFDLMESNLEATSINDKGTYVCLSRTLNLISVVDDLASNNKTFRSTWMERRSLVLNAFSERLLEQQAQTHVSGIHQDLLLQLLVVGRRLRPSIEEEKGLERLLPLLHNPSPEIQVEVYHLLVPLVASRNERVVVEAAVENDQASPCELPHQLLEVLSPEIILDDEEDLLERGLAAFLPWFLVLEFFEDISIKVKNGYAESLTTSGLVVSRLVPILISSLDLKPPNKPFQIEMWAVDEFYLDLLDTSLPSRFRVLASHLLHRALTVIPSSIRLWFQDLKDRKLADAISLYTSRYFTPLITEQELSRLKEMGSSEEFSDENFSIKVHSGVREVSAIYTVDDQQMNIRAAFPPDYPLRSINVEGGQQLGIPSNKWKAWLLNVQMVANQTGSLVDAIALWKKNISLHFEGQVECAICYSVISVTDRSLPKKPCQTCNNRFHSSCLYKWFKTSHNSTCPLCRSNIM